MSSNQYHPSDTESFQIRDMREDDLPQVIEIEHISFSTPWSEESFLTEISNPLSLCLVATKGSLIIGYICGGYVMDEGHILDLAVRPEFRRRGVAKRLVRHMLGKLYLCGCKEVFLEVRASNMAARNLYESLGFRMAGLRRGYYIRPKEDAAIMKFVF